MAKLITVVGIGVAALIGYKVLTYVPAERLQAARELYGQQSVCDAIKDGLKAKISRGQPVANSEFAVGEACYNRLTAAIDAVQAAHPDWPRPSR